MPWNMPQIIKILVKNKIIILETKKVVRSVVLFQTNWSVIRVWHLVWRLWQHFKNSTISQTLKPLIIPHDEFGMRKVRKLPNWKQIQCHLEILMSFYWQFFSDIMAYWNVMTISSWQLILKYDALSSILLGARVKYKTLNTAFLSTMVGTS